MRWDALIVGGGPAGSTCAARLCATGLSVLVVDRKTFPRDKTCAGWVTPQVFDTLGIDPNVYPASAGCSDASGGCQPATLQPITGFKTGLIGGEPIATHYGRVVSYGIRRCEFDRYLLMRSGAETRLGTPVSSVEWHGDRWVVNGNLEAGTLIGAGGHFCPIARRLGARAVPGASVVAAQEVEFRVDEQALAQCRVRPEAPELYFCPDLKGYGWCFRKGAYLNIGLGRVNAEHLAQHVAEFCDFLRDIGSVTCEIPKSFHGHAYQLYERVPPRLLDDGVLLIGDAAGLAYPHSGEGIRPAVESALFAADAIAAAHPQCSCERLQSYAAAIEQRFGRPRRRSSTDWLPESWLRFAGARLLASQAFTRAVVIDRWFLHAHQPALRL